MLTCGITMGDPAGIGPEVALKALKDKRIQGLANFIVVGNYAVLKKTAEISKLKLPLNNLSILDLPYTAKLTFGRGSPAGGRLALACLKEALRLIKEKKIDVLVTAPVNKHTVSQAGYFFRGHTEYFARACRVKNFAMMLIGRRLKVVLVTRHIALKEVARTLTAGQIYTTLRTSAWALRKYFGIVRPRIAVCGLNPHSGDEGLIGDEEERIIRPAVIKAKRFAQIIGPCPADTIFHSAWRGSFDAVCAMYHDQGLIPLKMLAFNRGVNLTLGLPFVRTCPDHGTAYDIAGKNKADAGSMKEAIKLAVKIGLKIRRVHNKK